MAVNAIEINSSVSNVPTYNEIIRGIWHEISTLSEIYFWSLLLNTADRLNQASPIVLFSQAKLDNKKGLHLRTAEQDSCCSDVIDIAKGCLSFILGDQNTQSPSG